MAERANPNDPSFRTRLKWKTIRGFPLIPVIQSSPYAKALKFRYRWVSQYANRKRVLDVPCGMGWGSSLIKGASEVVGIDRCAAAISQAKERYGHRGDLRFEVGEMTALPFTDVSFGCVACLEGIEHIDTPSAQQFFREAHRVLANDGLLLLTSPHTLSGEHSGNPFHIVEYLPEKIESLFSDLFVVRESFFRTVDTMQVDHFVLEKHRRNHA